MAGLEPATFWLLALCLGPLSHCSTLRSCALFTLTFMILITEQMIQSKDLLVLVSLLFNICFNRSLFSFSESKNKSLKTIIDLWNKPKQ